ncbi:MAG: histidine--tRNA ligase [Thermomicrobiales bacterium]
MTDETGQRTKRRPPRVLKGFRDYLPRQMILRQRIIQTVRAIFERHGFEPLDTPALEYLEVLTGKAGENEKLMYQFADLGGREVGLRYDLTVPLARVVAMHQNDIVLPFKRYHIAPVWRAENPQRGRFREFWQCDADVAGSASMIADAEIISMIAESLTALGLPKYTVLISHRRLLAGLAQAAGVPEDRAGTIYRSVDKLAKIGAEGVHREMTDQGVDADAARRVLDSVTIDGSPSAVLAQLRDRLSEISGALEAVDELQELFALLPVFGVPSSAYRLELSLARGLDYYTGPVYEAVVDEPKVGSVAGAGRYDDLIGAFLGRSVPATGMSLGLERIIEVIQEFDLLPVPATVAESVVISTPETVAQAANAAAHLRAAGLNVDFSLTPHRSFGDQLKYAGRKGIPVAVIVGSAEMEQGRATVKDLATGTQDTYSLEELADRVSQILARSAS